MFKYYWKELRNVFPEIINRTGTGFLVNEMGICNITSLMEYFYTKTGFISEIFFKVPFLRLDCK
jgi:hypothetical protein